MRYAKMALNRLTFAILLNLILLISVNCNPSSDENLDEEYRPAVWCLVNSLNQQPNRIYNYRYATLINAQIKETDIVDLTVDIEVECRYPDSNRCITRHLRCQGTVIRNSETAKYVPIPGTSSCKPKVVIDMTKNEDKNEKTLFNPNFQGGVAVEVSEKPFVKKRVYCLGCPVEIDITAKGVDSLTENAVRHIQTERENVMKLVKVINVKTQVVAGVKTIIVLEVTPTTCQKNTDKPTDMSTCLVNDNAKSEICEVQYLQQSWLGPSRNIISNNCTETQEFTVREDSQPETTRMDSSNDMDNEIDVNYVYNRPTEFNSVDENVPNFDSIADNGQVDDILKMPESIMSPQLMKDLEPQIVYPSSELSSTETSRLTEEQKSMIDDLFGEQPRKKRSANTHSNSEEVYRLTKSKNKYKHEKEKLKQKLSRDVEQEFNSGEYKTSNKHKRKASSESSASSSSEEHKNTPTTNQPETTTVLSRRKRAPELEKVPADKKDFVRKLADFAIMNLDHLDEDNHKRLVLQVLGAKKLNNNDGDIYHLTLRVGVSRCHEDTTKSDDFCRERLMENLTKLCKVQLLVQDEKKLPKVMKTHCQNMKTDEREKNRTKRRDSLVGGVEEVDPENEEIKKYIGELIGQVNNASSSSITLIQVYNATTQVVAGQLYTFHMKIRKGNTETDCKFKVWDRPWIPNGKEVTISCADEPKQKLRLRRSLEYYNHHKEDHDFHFGMFKKFTKHFNKKYKNKKEMKKRYDVFRKNLKKIKELNDNEQGTAKYGPTKFADLTTEEFRKFLGFKPQLRNENNVPWPKAVIPNIELPTEFDWRNKGAVSEVKNQGSCGSCWAFSVTGNIEGLNEIKTGQMIELSEQELVDCDKLDDGCSGGLPDNAYRAIEQLGGLETETDYPYDAENEKCHMNNSTARVQISGAVNISSDETDMAKWLVGNAPISIGLNANAMQFYMGGISHPWKFLCNPDNLDHGVLIVGYGVHKYPMFNKIMPYWIVKNSWGKDWGEQGYYRVYRGDGTCGVNQMASSAVL